MVTDLERLSKALSDDTPEKLAERAISQNADKIARALETNGVYEDAKLGLRISANNGRAGH
jgi:ABC-type branched-subunit amino acid transport system substrate-binding protein